MKSLEQLDLKNKKVLLRLNLNVPIKDGEIIDDFRIQTVLPTIEYCKDHAKQTIIIAHLGRPLGRDEQFSLKPVFHYLEKVLQTPIVFVNDCIGDQVSDAIENAGEGSIVLLENLRFHDAEVTNDEGFGKALSDFADVYINDAFGDSAKATASIMQPPKLLPSGAGYRLQKEVEVLTELRDNPTPPMVIVIGGAKIKEKMGVIKELGEKADVILVGGGVANTLLLAQGTDVQKSLVHDEELDSAKLILEQYSDKIVLPIDAGVAVSTGQDYDFTTFKYKPVGVLENNEAILDIGVQSFALFEEILSRAQTVFWAGPIGYIENPASAKHSIQLAQLLAGYAIDTYMGGGETASVLEMAELKRDEIDFISTGGGASLKFLSGEDLPGLQALS